MRELGFNEYELEDKARFILNEGTFISRVDYYELEISLYKIYGEMVEIWFNTVNDKVTKIKYTKESKFNPFLKFLKATSLN